jgi:hypothetical protein
VFLAELAGVEQAGGVGDLDSLPIQGFVEFALAGLPLLQLVGLAPGGGEQVHAAVGDAVAADVGSEYALEGFAVADVPGDEGLVPAPRVDQVLVLQVAVELGAVDAVGVAVVGCVGLLQFQHLLAFDFVVDADYGVAAGG